MMNKSTKRLFVLTIMLFVVIFVVGVSYAYTHANFLNVENSTTIAVNGGKMEIIYNDPNGGGHSSSITAEGVIPGWETTKLFTVTGTNEIDSNQTVDTNMYYKVGLVVEENTFSAGALKYELTPDNGDATPTGQVLNKLTGNVPQSGTEWFGMGYFVPSGDAVVHKYALKISFPETGQNQNIDKGKHFAGYVTITDEGEFVNLSVIVDSEKPELNYNLRLLKNSGIYLETPVSDVGVFDYWNIVSGNATIDGNKILVGEEDVVVETVWETRSVTLAIDLDGGISDTIQLSQSVLGNSSVFLDIPIKEGFIFLYWQVVSGDAIVSGQTILMGHKNTVLKAIWKDVVPVFTYLKDDGSEANYRIIRDTKVNWRIKFLETGNLIFSDLGSAQDGIDLFLVGGGGGGGGGVYGNNYAGGGGGGYTKTEKGIFVEVNQEYDIIVGAGGAGGEAQGSGGVGGFSSAFTFIANGGSYGVFRTYGGAGGSGGGGAGGGRGGSDGSDGVTRNGSGGKGQGTTTREFGEDGATLYAGGGGGGAYSCTDATYPGTGGDGGGGDGACVASILAEDGEANTGGGGGGGAAHYQTEIGGDGGSGVVIIRNAR